MCVFCDGSVHDRARPGGAGRGDEARAAPSGLSRNCDLL
jgi:hypothetical protein